MVQLSKMLPACGFVIAVALVGLTSSFKEAPKNTQSTYTFEYQAPDVDPYSATNVKDLSNWKYTEDPVNCGGSTVACSIEAPSTYVDASGTDPELTSSINIQTISNTAGQARVSNVATGASYSNKNP